MRTKMTPEEKQALKKQRHAEREHKRMLNKRASGMNQKPIDRMRIELNWYRNRTWGMCPKVTADIDYKDGTCASFTYGGITGCGYDKISTAVAKPFNEALLYKLYAIETLESEVGERRVYGVREYECSGVPIRYFEGGVGIDCYYPIAKFLGGKLERIVNTKTRDVFVYTDLDIAPGTIVEDIASPFGNVSAFMAMARFMAPEGQENDSALRILSAATGGAVSVPPDWDTLSEEEKQRRLDNAAAVLS